MRRTMVMAVATAIVMIAVAAPGVLGAGFGPPWDSEVVGTDKADDLKGGPGKDKISGLGGDDVLVGWAGRDMIVGGAGADQIRGGTGGDLLIGGAGADVLRGGDGRDELVGGPGFDKIYGGNHDDVIKAQGGHADFIDCGDGDGDAAYVDAVDTVTGCETVLVD